MKNVWLNFGLVSLYFGKNIFRKVQVLYVLGPILLIPALLNETHCVNIFACFYFN